MLKLTGKPFLFSVFFCSALGVLFASDVVAEASLYTCDDPAKQYFRLDDSNKSPIPDHFAKTFRMKYKEVLFNDVCLNIETAKALECKKSRIKGTDLMGKDFDESFDRFYYLNASNNDVLGKISYFILDEYGYFIELGSPYRNHLENTNFNIPTLSVLAIAVSGSATILAETETVLGTKLYSLNRENLFLITHVNGDFGSEYSGYRCSIEEPQVILHRHMKLWNEWLADYNAKLEEQKKKNKF